MNKSINIGLFVLLIIQAALIVYLYRPGQNNAPPAASLFSGLQADTVNALVITDDNGKSVHLTKSDDHWTVGDNQYPADNDKVKNIIDRIAKLQSGRLVARSKGSHSRLKVGDRMYNRKVVMTAAGQKDITFFLGTAPSSKSIHLRRAGDDDVYEVSGLSSWELPADEESWWQTKYVALNPTDIQGLTLSGSETISLHRDAKGDWQLAEAPAATTLDNKKMANLLRAVSKISISAYENKDFTPHGKPVATITYKTKDKSFDLTIWPQDKKANEQVIKTSTARFYAKVRPYTLKEVLDLKKADLVKPVPGPKQKKK